MEDHKDLNKKLSGKSKQTVDLKKMLEIVEGGFNTQEINSDESESGSENESVSVIPPTPKERKINGRSVRSLHGEGLRYSWD